MAEQFGAYTPQTSAALAAQIGASAPLFRNVYYVDAVNGSDVAPGTRALPLRTVDVAYGLCVAGMNDCIALIGNGGTASTWRLSANFSWAKDATHLVGLSSGVNISNRSRIAPTAGVTAFANFFTIPASGCFFSNLQWFQGFGTGVAAEICLTVTGGRNYFLNCDIAGMGDTVGAHDTGSRCIKISGTGENQFVGCNIGVDTVVRDVANANIEFAGGAPRNEFRSCTLPMLATATGVLGVIVSAAAGSDRFQLFDRLTVLNAIKSGAGTSITGLCSLAAAMGGLIMFRDLAMVGVSSLGADATSKAQIYEFGPGNSTSTGIGANPA